MKRYVIVSLINGEAQIFHENLVKEVYNKFNVKPQKLPMHITLKAPFEISNIDEIEKVTREFCESNNSTNIKVKDYGHFRDNVIFMNIIPSLEAIKLHERYYEILKTISNLEWSKNESKNRKFHCTIASKRISNKFDDIWNYVNEKDFEFDSKIDNISIMEYNFEKYKWDLYKMFKLK